MAYVGSRFSKLQKSTTSINNSSKVSDKSKPTTGKASISSFAA